MTPQTLARKLALSDFVEWRYIPEGGREWYLERARRLLG